MAATNRDAVRLPLAGLALLLVLAGLAAAAIADYTGAFAQRTEVTLYVPDAGNQLSIGAQVKVRGAVVGTVDEIEPSSRGARLTLALDPDLVHLVPKDTVARILPKTLVGQDYVDLVVSARPSPDHVEDGDEILRDTSAASATLEGALDELLEVLQVIPPQQIASTLNAVSTALEGRGAELGATLTRLQRYLDGLNPSLPVLTADLEALARFSDTYTEAAPDLLAAFDDLSTTASTLAEQREELASLFTSLTGAGDGLEGFLAANEENLIDVVDVNRTTLTTLATYSPEFPCLMGQLAGLVPRVDRIFGKGDPVPALHITLKVTNSRGKYRPDQDEPAYLDTRGPRCYEIVRFAPQHPADGPIQDGSVPPPPPERREIGPSERGSAALLLGPLLSGEEVTVR